MRPETRGSKEREASDAQKNQTSKETESWFTDKDITDFLAHVSGWRDSGLRWRKSLGPLGTWITVRPSMPEILFVNQPPVRNIKIEEIMASGETKDIPVPELLPVSTYENSKCKMALSDLNWDQWLLTNDKETNQIVLLVAHNKDGRWWEVASKEPNTRLACLDGKLYWVRIR